MRKPAVKPRTLIEQGVMSWRELIAMTPKATLWGGEDPETYRQLRTALLVELAPVTPYETLLVENLVDVEWDYLRHRRLRDSLVAARMRDTVFEMLRALAERTGSFDDRACREASDASYGLLSRDEAERQPAVDYLEKKGLRPDEVAAKAYHEVLSEVSYHETRLIELETRRRRLRNDIGMAHIARPEPLHPVKDAELLDEFK